MRIKYTGVRAEMARREVSQQELARRLDLHYNTVNNWLRGESDPGLGTIIDALLAIGMSLDEILGMTLDELVTVYGNEKAPV